MNTKEFLDNFHTIANAPGGIARLREMILQLAVQGKLVQQDPNDEPASELLKRIEDEKKRLTMLRYADATQHKLRDTKSTKVGKEEIPFQIPSNWEWVRLYNISNIISGNAFESADFNNLGGVKVVKITNAGVNEFIETDEFLPETFLNKHTSFIVKEGDLILALTRPYISNGLKICICPKSYHNSLLNQRVAAIKVYNSMSRIFVYFFLSSEHVLKIYQNRFNGTGLQPNLKVSDVSSLLFPLPPLEEQKRIVEKVDSLMALCDRLKKELREKYDTAEKLAKAVVESITGIQNEEKEKLKRPKTELVSLLRLSKSPTTKDHAPLSAILLKQKGEMSAKNLWLNSGMEIDRFYNQLKTEMHNGWIVEPEKAYIKETYD
jgi:type I restriction enzyme, S subunit